MTTPLIREFQADHQRITGTLLRLKRAIGDDDLPQLRSILASVDPLLAAHFKFEERHLYPALAWLIGDHGVSDMVREHDDVFEGVGGLVALASMSAWTPADHETATRHFGRLTEHPEHCDSLCCFIERLPEDTQKALLRHMDAIRRERPAFAAYADERQAAPACRPPR